MPIARHDLHPPVDRIPCAFDSLEANPSDDDSDLYVVSIRKTFLEMLSTFRHDMLPAERPKRVTNHPTPLQAAPAPDNQAHSHIQYYCITWLRTHKHALSGEYTHIPATT